MEAQMADLDQKFLEDTVKILVKNPEDVKTERKVDEMGVLIELTVNPEDMGTVIGKEGNTAKALRTLLRVVGAKNNARINLKIVEPEGSTRPVSSRSTDDQAEEKVEEIKKVKDVEDVEDIEPIE
jgi:predicted RNA-binding protein YlqC (UPF0109 family)